MAKELPYFKFEPAEYITKDISFCSYAAQGLFINLCSHYWQRNCEMTLSQAERRFKDKELINELLEEGVVSHENGKLIIKFLNRQREEAIEKSNVNKANGSKGGRPPKAKQKPKETENKPNGYDSLSETKGIRRDKIIKEEIKENESREVLDITRILDIKDLHEHYLSDERLTTAIINSDKNNLNAKTLPLRLKEFTEHLESQGRYKETFEEYAKYFLNWAKMYKDKNLSYEESKRQMEKIRL